MSQPGSPLDDWIQSALETYEGRLLQFARRITGNLERAQDVVQETFLRLCREDPAELDGHLAEWLYAVCRNKALDVRRKESRMSAIADETLERTQSEAPQPDDIAERNESVSQVLELLSQLPDNQQEVVRLKFQGGLKYREISEVTGHSVTNVGFLIHRGVSALREKMQRIEAS
ncbi:MAG: sigma-70 family RNA polymerase sigma factor [Planctomycetota bacterium]|nr:sigma-70 family RNA polymerase sigma factor [Planctomycetota bacterium]